MVYKPFDGAWNVDGIKTALAQALNDPEVEVIYAAGVVSSMLARALPDAERTKPVYGGAVHYSDVREFPITAEGKSSVANFSFISSPQRVGADLQLLARMANSKTVHVFMDRLLYENMPNVQAASETVEAASGVTLTFV